MTRVQILTAAMAACVCLAPVIPSQAQSSCGPEVWSGSEMRYKGVPCNGANSPQQAAVTAPAGARASCGVETWSAADMRYKATPCAAGQQASNSTTSSSSMLKEQMKRGIMPGATTAQPAPVASVAANDTCTDLHAAAIKDEFGHKYNCKGARIR